MLLPAARRHHDVPADVAYRRVLLIAGSTFNVFSAIGVIMLMGLVVKNAILLVDFFNQVRQRGIAVPEALLEAGSIRLRPILMTTLAMVFGMMPLGVRPG